VPSKRWLWRQNDSASTVSRGGTYLSLTFTKSHLTGCGSEQTSDLHQSSVTKGNRASGNVWGEA
jgi:hypothetical protein